MIPPVTVNEVCTHYIIIANLVPRPLSGLSACNILKTRSGLGTRLVYCKVSSKQYHMPKIFPTKNFKFTIDVMRSWQLDDEFGIYHIILL